MPNPVAKRSALLIVDMQVGLFHGPERPYQHQRLLATINQLIDRARTAGVPIMAARHSGPAGSPIEPGSALWQLLPELAVDSTSDWVFDKTRPSCFLATGLAERLAAEGIDQLVIAGMKTQYCIDSTCRAAAELGTATSAGGRCAQLHGHPGGLGQHHHRAPQPDPGRRLRAAAEHR